MIGHLKGTVLGTRKNAILLDVHDVGYLVHVTQEVLQAAVKSTELTLSIHTHETSDTVSLFGFRNENELQFFELLTSVNGVGPKTALAIMENPIDKLQALIASGNAKELAKTPGVGPKTAARIVLELKNKLIGGAITVPDMEHAAVTDDILDALESLGYKKAQVKKILTKLPPEITRTEEIVTWFLRNI